MKLDRNGILTQLKPLSAKELERRVGAGSQNDRQKQALDALCKAVERTIALFLEGCVREAPEKKSGNWAVQAVCSCLPPAVLGAAGILLGNKPAAVCLLLAGVMCGELLRTWLLPRMRKGNAPAPLRLTWEPELPKAAAEEICSNLRQILELLDYTGEAEPAVPSAGGLEEDRQFAAWLQRFIRYAGLCGNADVAALKSELCARLMTHGIFAYEQFRYDANGQPKLPHPDAFVFKAPENQAKVTLPCIFTARAVLAPGEAE